MRKKKTHENHNSIGKIIVFFSILFLIVFVLAFVLALYFFGFAGFFYIFDVKYESVGALLLYVIFILLLSFVIEWIAKVFVALFTSSIKSKNGSIIIEIFIEIMFAWVTLMIVDEIVVQVTVSTWLELLAACILVMADFAFDSKNNRKKKSKDHRK